MKHISPKNSIIDIFIKSIIISVIFIFTATLCVLIALLTPRGAVAQGVDFGALQISYDSEKYVCDGTDYNSLQSIIDYAESAYSETVYVFDNCTAIDEPLVFKKQATLQGNLGFTLDANDYAITAASGSNLILQGTDVTSNRGALKVRRNGRLEIRSATITVENCTANHSAINVSGTAFISGGQIKYDKDNAFGYGISVNESGNLNVTPAVSGGNQTVPVIVEGQSGLCLASGTAEINGGTFSANGFEESAAGYSVAVQEGAVTINDGVFNSPIYDGAAESANVSINGGSIPSVRVTPYQNKKLRFGSLTLFAGIYCDLTIFDLDFSANSLKAKGEKNSISAGFRVVGYNVGNTNTDTPVLSASTDVEKTVTPIEDNRYFVSLSCDDAVYDKVEYVYGSTVKLNELPSPQKNGYVLKEWREKKGNFVIADDITLNANTALADTQIELDDANLTYDGSEQTVAPILSHDLSVAYSVYWEKYASGGWKRVSNENELKVTAVADSGQYRITVVATYGADTSTTQKEIAVTVNKGDYVGITHSPFSGTYDPDKRLSGYALSANFNWVKVTDTPTVPIKQYPAIYNADPDNYNDCTVYITIDLEKADVKNTDVPPHKNLSGVYQKKKLKDYALQEGFRWQSPDEIPIVSQKSYVALYNPDRDNYNDVVRNIILNLEMGTYDGIARLEDMTITYRPNYYLSDLNDDIAAAHPNYKLNYKTNSLIYAGTRTLDCVYNEDADNYNDYEFSIGLTVNKADVDPASVPSLTPITGYVYGGLTLASYPLPKDVYWLNPTLIPTVDVQQYAAYCNPSQKNYNDYPLTVTLILQKGTYSNVAAPTLAAITYGRDLTLSGVSLPAGWSWADGSVTPTVAVGSYDAEYCADPVNYLPIARAIPLEVKKADIPLAKLPDKTVTYDGEKHSLAFESLPYPLALVEYKNNGKTTAGKYEVTAKLSQTDLDNYNPHPTTVRGILNILKAPSVIVAPVRYDVLEGESVLIEGTVENDEQNLVIPPFNETAFGLYHITLTTAESGNYLAGSHTVTISINRTEKYVGNISYPVSYDGSYLYGILINPDCGVPNDAQISFRPFSDENHYLGIEISVTTDGEVYEKQFIAKIKMTDAMLSARSLSLLDADGEKVAFTV
ncbi:MAG: hypothetical protein NC179_04430, partial [[Eubacterium] siraeum]|nr:hypothetical protein [[Eubacterium] siraeum]